jgi:hypothetical protein
METAADCQVQSCGSSEIIATRSICVEHGFASPDVLIITKCKKGFTDDHQEFEFACVLSIIIVLPSLSTRQGFYYVPN